MLNKRQDNCSGTSPLREAPSFISTWSREESYNLYAFTFGDPSPETLPTQGNPSITPNSNHRNGSYDQSFTLSLKGAFSFLLGFVIVAYLKEKRLSFQSLNLYRIFYTSKYDMGRN